VVIAGVTGVTGYNGIYAVTGYTANSGGSSTVSYASTITGVATVSGATIKSLRGAVSLDANQFNISTGWATVKQNGLTLDRLTQISGLSVIGNSSGSAANPSAINLSAVLEGGLSGNYSIPSGSVGTGVLIRTGANNFGTILVAGQSNVVAGTLGAPVTFVAGTNATITTDAINKTITFNSVIPSYLIKTSGYTAASGDKILANTTSSAFTITLPASPSAGNYVTISSGPYVAINKLTVGRNSSTIMGLSEDMDITVNNTSIDFVYDGSTWRIA
jgi:hypothetical protein